MRDGMFSIGRDCRGHTVVAFELVLFTQEIANADR